MIHRRAPALLAVLILVSSACSGGEDESGGGRTTGTRPQATTSTTAGPGCRFIVASDGRRRRGVAADQTVEYLVDAVAEPTGCYDKITFTFDPGDGPDLPPGYHVEYREPPFVEGVNSTTEGFGDAHAVIYVEIEPASQTDRRAGGAVQTYKGNLRLRLEDMSHTVIVEFLRDIPDPTPDVPDDDKIVWLIGLDTAMPFTVDAANQPPRITVYVMNERAGRR